MAGEIKKHRVSVTGRESVEITAVTGISEFDDKSVILETEFGTLHIGGSDLTVTRLDLDGGEAGVTGKISGIFYMETQNTRRRRRRGGE